MMGGPTVSAPKRETDPKKGCDNRNGACFDLWERYRDILHKLLDGVSGITFIDIFDASEYSARFAGKLCDYSSTGCIDGKNDRRLDEYASLNQPLVDTMSISNE